MSGILIFFVWFVVSFIVGVAATRRGRSGSGWFFVSFLLSPILALLLLLVFPSLRDQREFEFDDEELRKNIRRGRQEPRV